VDVLRGTRLGARVFERAYWTYKRVVEAHGVAALSKYVEPGGLIIDVGANLGFFSRLFVGFPQSPRVVAIEPESRNIASLRRGIAKWGDGRVVVVEAAAVDIDGVVNLNVDKNNHADHQVSDEGVPITGVRLDTLMTTMSLAPVSLIKIDVQGAEERVLRGSSALIHRDHPTVFTEIDPVRLAKQGSDPQAVLDILLGEDYEFFLIDRNERRRVNTDEVLSAVRDGGYVDVLAVWSGRDLAST
jgi:FkbM family methyltransferase